MRSLTPSLSPACRQAGERGRVRVKLLSKLSDQAKLELF